MNRLVYLAHPVDFGEIKTADVTAALAHHGYAVYDPGAAWTLSPNRTTGESALAVYNVNMEALGEADTLVALVNPAVRSVGVPAEIQVAVDANHAKRVFVLMPLLGYRDSLMINAWDFFLRDSGRGGAFTSLDALMAAL